ncbi:hypothetical protein TPHA_0N01700 [Tetrapisispora phaffii CBS 4417]|uniref:Holocytochrome c-type synthase n=1 Tax=Tetrapisispora phaffii (strain ATCC 24235 / CBS 4417 / NBRC 1672 / NRRL Y-8282 / UCD 70-5) TaxID=1071381 RepID=G8C1C3_TETPH|nr:hypothetical protein TPHA_0N01700 [Tetrapisispora phaffii CBS 4417]CCE65951.1 hypothetical protein TPHA_0N01700 [Tetrapisispora phaffii CBS 4417]
MGDDNSKDKSTSSSWMGYIWNTGGSTTQGMATVDEQSKCPVNHGNIIKPNVGGCPVDHPNIKVMPPDAKCPVDDDARKIWLQKQALQPALLHDVECSSDEIPQTPVYKTDVKLPDEREVSSIPRTGHGSNWIYPSEKQFYEAMIRKKWNPEADDMKTVVPLHNSVNERVWNCIKNWETAEENDLKLTSFKGDAKKVTPRAWIRSNILGLSKPFDRHDWTINRNGKEIDYVIDFYSTDDDDGKKNPNATPSIYLDVRPKLNSIEGIKMRVMKSLAFQKNE